MIKRMVIMLVAVAVVLTAIFGFQVFKGRMIKTFMSAMASPPQTISTTRASTSAWQPKVEAVGSLRAVKGADLSLEVAGVVDEISFNSGDDVKEGQLLATLDDSDYKRSLDSAKADRDASQAAIADQTPIPRDEVEHDRAVGQHRCGADRGGSFLPSLISNRERHS